MSRIFLINVGANSYHRSRARSPVFEDGSFIYVPFPATKQTTKKRTYPNICVPFTRNLESDLAHVDPDWENLTYGDDCKNARAVSLKKVVEDDILLFWGMLWKNIGDNWSGFTGEHDWYLLGALRVVEIVSGGKYIQDISAKNRNRAEHNIHFIKEPLSSDERIFIGDKAFSAKFAKAVNLEVKDPHGLLYHTFTSASGKPLSYNSKPNWKSSLRSCRIVFDLGVKEQYQRAKNLRKAILATNGFDLLQGIE